MSSSLRSKLALPEATATIALLVLAVACAALLFAQERRVSPDDLPSLTLPADAVQRVLQADARAAAAAPSTERARALAELLLEHGAAEARGVEDAMRYRERRGRLERGYRELASEVGDQAALRLREKSLLAVERALALELSDAEARRVLGALPAVLAREGASRGGEIVAPHFVVRTLAKARWNLLHGLARDHGFAQVEKRAYYGWQALHADRVALPLRVQALQAYARAGGDRADEALGILLLRQGDPQHAARALHVAYRKSGSIRLRNALLAVHEAAEHRE